MLLGLTRLLTLVLPFRVVRHLLGDHRAPRTAATLPPAGPRETGRARRIGWLVQVAATRTPWRSDCYPQALSARLLLRALRVPHRMTFGVRRDESGTLKAHVWVSAGGVTVTGGSTRDWAEVGAFVWVPRH
ncbi:lasso peptide biosynthesis B2 protein [Nocardioides sp. LML1-1-1.1]